MDKNLEAVNDEIQKLTKDVSQLQKEFRSVEQDAFKQFCAKI